jgi:NNP family nitrate/nitrite transporter-like MFS transporter
MEEQKSNFRWLILAVLFLTNIAGFYSVICIPPLFMEIVEQIPLTKAEMGSIMGVVVLSSLFFAPFGGGISDKIGSRWAAGAGILIAATAGVLRAYTESSIGLIACMFFVGAGLSVFAPNMPKVVGIWFPRNELALANGICTAGVGIGGAVAMATSASLMSPAFGGWRNVMLVIGGVVFTMGILWILIYRDRKVAEAPEKKKQNMVENFKKVLKVKDLWSILLYRGFIMAGFMPVTTFLPIVLHEKGVARAGEHVSIMMGISVVFNILGGIVSDRIGKRKPFLLIGAVIQGIAVFFFASLTGVPLIMALVVAGIAMGTLAPVLFTVPVELKEIGPGLAASAIGLLLMVGNACGFLGPIISGKLIDLTGSNFAGFIFMGAAIIAAAGFILPLRETGKGRNKKEAG